jgi:bla regulator protein blaR1
MTSYIIKVILCSGLFLLVYKLLLEKEKMHRFNRLYLLATPLLSFVIPLISFSWYSAALPDTANLLPDFEMLTASANTLQSTSISNTNNAQLFWPVAYAVIAVFLLARLLLKLKSILVKSRNHPVIPYGSSKIVLIDEDITPHSFLNAIFINQSAYQNGGIEAEIMAHELAHIQQRHSWDILLAEFLQALCWINPFLYPYRKAIQLNHEFLADEAVLTTYDDVTRYQYLLIEKAAALPGAAFSSRFNYSITKKRLLMMTKTKSPVKVFLSKISVIPVLAISILVFSTKQIQAQDTPAYITLKKQQVPSTQEGVSQELLNEYAAIVDKTRDEKGQPSYVKFSEADKQRLETIFLKMSREQQAKQTVIFLPSPPPLPRTVPTAAQLNAWKNAKIYGVWINGKKVNNAALNKYRNTDFAQLNISKLYGAAKKNVPYFYQVNLMTTDYYDAYYKQTVNGKKYFMAFRWGSPVVKEKMIITLPPRTKRPQKPV